MKQTNNKQLLQIGDVAREARVTPRTVRYYLEKGFIHFAERSSGGFYLFTPDAAETVFYIQKLKEAGFALRDVERIYLARRQGKTGEEASSRVVEHLQREQQALEQKIRDYQELKSEIEQAVELAKQCRGCSYRPTRENCLSCEVLLKRHKLPLPIQAIL